MRAELSAYLASLKASTSITLPDDFDQLVDALSEQSTPLSSSPTATPHWLTHDIAPQPAMSDSAVPNNRPPPLPLAAQETIVSGEPLSEFRQSHAAGLGRAELRVEDSVAASSFPLVVEMEALTCAVACDEEAELAKIAELDQLLERLTAASAAYDSHIASLPFLSSSTHSTDSAVPTPTLSDPAAHDAPDSDEDDEQSRTFITAVYSQEAAPRSSSSHEEQKETLTIPPSDDDVRRSSHVDEVDDEQPMPPVELRAGEGFTLTATEAARLGQIDALIAGLQADEKEGKRRRFITRRAVRPQRVRDSADNERGDAKAMQEGGRPRRGAREDGKAKLPSIASSASQPPPIVPAGAPPSADGTASSYVESLSALLDSCLSSGERQRYEDIEARLAQLSASPADPIVDVGLTATDADDQRGPDERRVAFDADAYLHSIHPQPSLAFSSLREWYAKDGAAPRGPPAADGDDYDWLDEQRDGEEEAAMDEREVAESVLPDSDDDDHSARWKQLKALPLAPDPDADAKAEDEEPSDAHSSIDERAEATAAGTEATKRRVRRLIGETEERKRRLTAADTARGTEPSRKDGMGRRVRTSDESRKPRSAVHLSALSGRRPASAEAAAAAEREAQH